MVGGRRPLVEDDLQWKKTFGGRRPLVEDDLRWKTTFGGRRHLVEDNLWWKTTFCGRCPLVDPCLLPTLLCGIFFCCCWLITINISVNEKIYIFLWFWFLLLGFLTCLVLIYRILIVFSPRIRVNSLTVTVFYEMPDIHIITKSM